VRKQLLMAAALAGFLAVPPPAASLPDPEGVFTGAAPEPPSASSAAAPAFAAHMRLRHARAERRRHQESRAAVSPELQAIAACESHGNPRAVGGGGAFRGKYQFDYGTWASVGGEGDPAAAPESEQDMRAAILLQRAGTSPWPNCG
jgi:hypothetical protein